MKAEERHQLKENDLASWVQYGLPIWLKENGSYLVLGLALCFLAYQLYNLYERKQESTRSSAESDLIMANSSENPAAKLQSVIETYDIPNVKVRAYLELGEYYEQLLLSPAQMQNFKVTRSEALEKAGDAFKKALEIEGGDNLVAAKATLGLAAVLEDKGDWEGAKKQYETLSDAKGRFGGTPFAEKGEAMLKSMPERQKAPRLVEMMPPPPPPTSRPALGGAGMPAFPGMMGPLPEKPYSAGATPDFAPPTTGPAPAVPSPGGLGLPAGVPSTQGP